MQAHRGDFQPARKTGNNVVLFLIGPQCEIDGLDLQDLDVTAIGHFKDAIPQIPDSEIVLDKIKLLLFCPWLFCVFFLFAAHIGNQPSCNEAYGDA